MTRIKNPRIGDPLGFKVNCSDAVDLDALIDALKVYHGDTYIVGKDTQYCDKHHYHINFFAVKDINEGALKVFRNSLGKKFPWLTKSDKLYTGEELESADPNRWIAYTMKCNLVKVNGIEITDEIKILAKACLENKRQKKVYSEKKKNDETEKKDARRLMFDYVKANMPLECNDEYTEFCETCISYFLSVEKYGCCKMTFLKQYYIEYKTKYTLGEKWNSKNVFRFISI